MPIAPNGCTRCDGFGGTGWEPCPECLGGEDIDDEDHERAYLDDVAAEQHADAMAGLAFDQQQRADQRDAAIVRSGD